MMKMCFVICFSVFFLKRSEFSRFGGSECSTSEFSRFGEGWGSEFSRSEVCVF